MGEEVPTLNNIKETELYKWGAPVLHGYIHVLNFTATCKTHLRPCFNMSCWLYCSTALRVAHLGECCINKFLEGTILLRMVSGVPWNRCSNINAQFRAQLYIHKCEAFIWKKCKVSIVNRHNFSSRNEYFLILELECTYWSSHRHILPNKSCINEDKALDGFVNVLDSGSSWRRR